MNILVFSQFAGSPQYGMVFRNFSLAREWVRQGHRVTIVASAYSHFRNTQPPSTGRITREDVEGVTFLWLWGPRYDKNSNAGRLLSMAAYVFQAQFMSLGERNERYDFVVASSPHPFSIYPARAYARRHGARLVYDIRDLWPLTPIHLGKMSTRHPFIRMLQHAEDYACKHADLVTAVPGNCEPYLQTRGLPPNRFLPIGNGASESSTTPASLPAGHAELLERLKQQGAFIVGYAGTLGRANAMDTIIDALPKTDSRVHLVIIGDGGMKQDLAQQARDLACADRVHFLAPVPRSQVDAFLQRIDVGFAATSRSPLYAYGASLTKLNDYMLAGVPILYAVGDPGNAVERSGGGFSCEPESADALADAMSKLLQMSEEDLRALGEQGRQWCLKHQLVKDQAARIIDTLNRVPPRHPA
jgi:glycosyltransferase involved in cell wall biosynthesis